MLRDQILQACRTAMQGSRKVKMTFIEEPEAIGYVAYLLGFSMRGMIELGADELVIRAIVASHDWDGDDNRTITVTLTDRFDEAEFASRFQHALEKIEAVS